MKQIKIISIILVIILLGGVFINLRKDNTTLIKDIKSDLVYSAVGDSITYGQIPITGGKMETPYPERVGELLGLKNVRNLGISGSTLTNKKYGIVNRMDKIPLNSDIISVFAGTNDWSQNCELGDIEDFNESTIYGALNIICSYLKTKFKSAFIFLITPYPRKNTSNNNQGYSLKDVRDAVIKIGDKYDLPVLNMFDNGHFETEVNSAISDGVHPSQEFILNYTAPQIANFIEENYKR